MKNIIPHRDLGNDWSTWDGQPNPGNILVTDDSATMPQITFDCLPDYTYTMPTALYEGRMWKKHVNEAWVPIANCDWLLMWVSTENNRIVVNTRKIIIADWKELFGLN